MSMKDYECRVDWRPKKATRGKRHVALDLATFMRRNAVRNVLEMAEKADTSVPIIFQPSIASPSVMDSPTLLSHSAEDSPGESTVTYTYAISIPPMVDTGDKAALGTYRREVSSLVSRALLLTLLCCTPCSAAYWLERTLQLIYS